LIFTLIPAGILKMLEFRLDPMEDIGIYTNSGWNGKNAQIPVATL